MVGGMAGGLVAIVLSFCATIVESTQGPRLL